MRLLFIIVLILGNLNAFQANYIDEHNKTIVLKQKTYLMDDIVKIKNSSNLIFDGNDSTLIVTNPLNGVFKIFNSQNITLKNFSVDYKYLPHVAGKILEINKKDKTIVFRPFKNYTNSLQKNISIESKKRTVYLYPLSKPGIVKKRGTPVTHIKSIVKKQNNYLILCKKIKKNIQVNDVIVLVFRNQGGSISYSRNSDNITYDNITIYAGTSGNFVAKNTSNVTIQNSKILLKPERWLSANADGVHCQSCRTGPKIINNHFEGIGDDAINIYTIPLSIEKISKNILVKPKYFTNSIKKDDMIYFFNPKIGKIIHKNRIKSFKIEKNGISLSFMDPLPKLNKSIQLYNMNLTGSGFAIEGNTFKNSRRYGILLKSHNGSIKNNIFEDLGGSAIIMRNSIRHYMEGLNSENILIENNNMKNCGFGFRKSQPLIEIKFMKEKGISKYDEQKNIKIINNVLNPYEKYYIIRNTKKLLIDN